MYISFRNGRIYRRTAVKDPFFIGFGKNIFSRKCCYSCRFRHPESRADITLADFWGAEKLNGTVADDNKGISLVLANTPKGKAAVESLAGKCYLKETVFSEAAALNPRLVSSAPMPALRSRFFGDLNSGMDFAGLQRKYMNTFIQSFKLWVKSILGEQALDGLRKLLGR
jgi:Coenzyme F420 hydrogenase/dehydrogenase, beta subunit C terminus.